MLQGHFACSACHHHCHCNCYYCHCLCHHLCAFVSVFVLVIVFVSPLICYKDTLPARLVIIIVIVIGVFVIVFWLYFFCLCRRLCLCVTWYATKTRYPTMAMIWFWSSLMLLCPKFLAFVKRNCSTLLDLWKVSAPVCECPWRLLIATIILPSLSLSLHSG